MFRTFLNSITKMFVWEGWIRRGDSGALAPGSFPQTRCSDISLRCRPLCGTTYSIGSPGNWPATGRGPR